MHHAFLQKLNRFFFRSIVAFMIYFICVHAYFAANVLIDKHPGSLDKGNVHYLVNSTFKNELTGKTIQFIGMRHVADDGFYREVNSLLASNAKSVAYTEGIDIYAFDYEHEKDTREYTVASALRSMIDDGYEARAKKDELVLQSDKLILTSSSRNADMPFRQLVTSCAASINCTLGAVGMHSRENRLKVYLLHPIAFLSFMDFLINTRNEYLMKQVLDPAAPKSILLPWGSEHYAGIRDTLLREGYKETARTWRKACEKCS